jgi:outer membrane protein assembly factor BamB
VYVAAGGVAGVDAATGELLWQTDAWRIKVATVPSAVVIDGERIFLSGGYDEGSMMLRIRRDGGGDGYVAEAVWTLEADVFGSPQHTPIVYEGHVYGVRPDGQAVCLGLDGNLRWTSGPAATFGLGPYMIAGGKLLLLDDDGLLTMAEATAAAWRPMASADVLLGHEAWGPMALAGGRLLVRDLTQLRCIDLRPRK